jgi:hypothetical protein
MGELKVRIVSVETMDELFFQRPGSDRSQPVVLALDLEDGELTAYYRADDSSRPASVYHRRTLWFDLPCLTMTAANDLLQEVEPLAQRILDGATIEWDGNNFIGQLTRDAQYAEDELRGRADPENWDDYSTQVVGFSAADWYGSDETAEETIQRLGVTAETTDAQLRRKADTERQFAHDEGNNYGCVVLTGVEQYLHDLRATLRIADR